MSDVWRHVASEGFRGLPLSTQLHVRVRRASAPLAAVEELVPPEGRILDFGCGHGLFALGLAAASPERSVLGVDCDDGRIDAAQRAARRLGLAHRASFLRIDGDWRPAPGEFDAVVIVDVLYLLPAWGMTALVDLAVDTLRPGGRLVLKEMADRPRWKRALTQAQERLAVSVMGITKGDAVRLPTETELRSELVARGLQPRRIELGQRFPHPHLAFVAETVPMRTPPPHANG